LPEKEGSRLLLGRPPKGETKLTKLMITRGKAFLVFICDACHKHIDDIGMTNAVWDMESDTDYAKVDLRIYCKIGCDPSRTTEEYIRPTCWMPLDICIGNIEDNLKRTLKKFDDARSTDPRRRRKVKTLAI